MIDAAAQLAAKNDRLARTVAGQYRATAYRWGIDHDDILQAARIGLYVGCQRFNPELGSLSTGVYPWILSYIRTEVAKHQPKGYREGSRTSARAKGRDLGPIPTTESLNDPGPHGTVEPIEMLLDERESQDRALWRKEITKIVMDCLKRQERLRVVLALRFGLDDGRELTFAEVGARLGVTRERARQLVNEALEIVRARLGNTAMVA